MPEQEMIDVYDRNRQRTGLVIPREGAFLSEGQYMLYVLALIEDAQGRFLITQRSWDKHWGAGWWEVTGGGVRAGESSLDALRREVPEEVGLDLGAIDARPVYSYENVDLKRGDNYFVDIYHLHLDFAPEDVSLVDGEAIDFRLATWEEIGQLAEAGTFLHYERLRQALEAERALPYQASEQTLRSLETWMRADLRPDLFVVAPAIRDVGERELIRQLARASYEQQGFKDSPRRHFISRIFPLNGSEARYAEFVDEPFDASEITDGFFGVDMIDLSEWVGTDPAMQQASWQRLTDYVIDHPETDFVFVAYTDDASAVDPLVRAIRETCSIAIEPIVLDYPSVRGLVTSFLSQCSGEYDGCEDYVQERISLLCERGSRPNHSFIKSCALSSLHELALVGDARRALEVTFDRFEKLRPLPVRTKIIGF